MIARCGACNHSNYFVLPFGLELIRLAAKAARGVKGHRWAIPCNRSARSCQCWSIQARLNLSVRIRTASG
jgi:hypothetical protein